MPWYLSEILWAIPFGPLTLGKVGDLINASDAILRASSGLPARRSRPDSLQSSFADAGTLLPFAREDFFPLGGMSPTQSPFRMVLTSFQGEKWEQMPNVPELYECLALHLDFIP